jgi:hypothetical protein
MAKELRHVMGSDWPILTVDTIRNVGPEWLFTLLEPLDEATRMIVLMIMWRIWHVRNKITHEKKPPPRKSLAVSSMGTLTHSYAYSSTQMATWSRGRWC